MSSNGLIPVVILIVAIVLAVILTLRNHRKKNTLSDGMCSGKSLHVTSLEVLGFQNGGQIAPTMVYQANTTFNVTTTSDFDNGGVLFGLEYPNESENGVVSGFAIADVSSGSSNTVTSVPCAVGWSVSGTPNSSTCKTPFDVEGWQVLASPVKKWTTATGVNFTQTTSSPSSNQFTITWDPVAKADVYAVSLTLVGDSYNPSNTPVPTTLSFGGLTSKTNMLLTTVGSNHFTAGIPEVQSVKVVGFNHCDLGEATSACLGYQN